jgi:hypothetical protein
VAADEFRAARSSDLPERKGTHMDTVKSADGSAAHAGLRLPDEMPGAGAAAQGFRQTRYVLTFHPGLPDSAASGNQPADQSRGSS